MVDLLFRGVEATGDAGETLLSGRAHDVWGSAFSPVTLYSRPNANRYPPPTAQTSRPSL